MKKLSLIIGISALALTACKKTESAEKESDVMLPEPEVKIVPDSTNKNNPASADYPQADSSKTTVPTAANTPVTKPAAPAAPAENAPAPAAK